MNIEKLIINCKTMESKSELYNNINTDLILGKDARSENNFYIFTILNSNGGKSLEFGLISELEGIKPKVVTVEENNLLIVGYNNKITAFKIAESQKFFEFELYSMFVDIIVIDSEKVLLVVDEIGIVAVSYKGQKKWSRETDLITNYKLENRFLILDFLDDDRAKLCINNGKYSCM